MTLDEARDVVDEVSGRLSEDAKINWGAQISEDLNDTIKTLLIVTGVTSPQIFGQEKTIKDQKQEEMESELNIEFVK